MKSQWECFLQNLGEWRGSFTQLSPQGEVLSDTPSVLSLEGLNNNQSVRLSLRRLGQPDLTLEYSTVGGGLKFFESGAFSQGTIQIAPASQFGAELALVQPDRRLRLVQIFSLEGQPARLTLIREQRVGTDAPERSPLTLADLLGEWHGQAITLYPDLREPDTYATTLKLHQDGDKVTQAITFAEAGEVTSTGTIQGSMLRFEQGSQRVQVLLLPDGASFTCPMQIQRDQPLFIEAGWLLSADLRQRLIRSYSSRGEWVSLTLVTEQKKSPFLG
ncbi:MAG: DUF3598 family protein [Leptolyngbyaceae cyanobacterium CSU_1_3]|nr:DUF3598 family protein [Leptolyngbyaceae cyanobacterium CSU_1_3]